MKQITQFFFHLRNDKYGTTVRPAVTSFQGNMQRKATCSCPIGLSRVCCHILEILL